MTIDSIIELLNSQADVTEAHAREAVEAVAALPVERFMPEVSRICFESPHDRVARLDVLMATQPAWRPACARFVAWYREHGPK